MAKDKDEEQTTEKPDLGTKETDEAKAETEKGLEEIAEGFEQVEHWLKAGFVSIGETTYEVVDGKVIVAIDHLQEMINHINATRP